MAITEAAPLFVLAKLKKLYRKSLMDRTWIPRLSVGGVPFGCSERELHTFGSFVRIPEVEDDFVGWNAYGIGDDFRVYCEAEKVVAIAVYNSLLYENREIIGLELEEVSRVVGDSNYSMNEPIEMGHEKQTPVDFEELGLQLWFRDGVAVSATCDDGQEA